MALDFSKIWRDMDVLELHESRIYIVMGFQILNSLVNRLRWLTIVYFVLEIKEVYLKLKSASPEDYKAKLRQHSKFR